MQPKIEKLTQSAKARLGADSSSDHELLIAKFRRKLEKVGKTSKPFSIMVIQVHAPNSNTEEAEVEWFYENLQDFLELTPKQDVLFIIEDWNAKVGSQEIPGVTGKLGFGVLNEAGQRLTEFCQENSLVIADTLFQQHKRRLYTWTSPDG